MESSTHDRTTRVPWNKGKLIGQKARSSRKTSGRCGSGCSRSIARANWRLLNLGIDSKLRACDLVSLRVRDITHGELVANRAIVQQKKTRIDIDFATGLAEWLESLGLLRVDAPTTMVRGPALAASPEARLFAIVTQALG